MTGQNIDVCNLLVKIDGKEEVKATSTKAWKTTNGVHVTSLSIDMKLDAPDQFELKFMASNEGERTVFDHVKEGAEVELGFGYDKPIPTLFKGEIIYVESEFDAQMGSFVVIRGYDYSHRLTRGMHAKTWGDGSSEDQQFSDVASEVISGSMSGEGEQSDGLSADQVDDTEFKSRWVPQAMTTNYDFLKWSGSSLGRASSTEPTDSKKVSFRKLDINSGAVATICAEKLQGNNPLRTIRARFTIATYPSYAKVRVHGWNSKEKKAFVGEATAASPELDCSSANSGWTPGWSAAGTAHYGSGSSGAIYERVMEYCESQEEADKLAQGLFDGFSLRHFTGECDVQGCPEIVPGAVVEFKGFGKRVSGKVLVTEATHIASATSGQPYTTTFRFCSNAAGTVE